MFDIGLTKRCCGCKEMKLRVDFYKNRSTQDGLNHYCKPCWNARIKAAIDSGKHSEYCKKSKRNEASTPEGLERQRERVRLWGRKKREQDPVWREKYRLRAREYYREHKEQCVHNVRARALRLAGAGGSHSLEAWRQLKALFGNRCVCCGKQGKVTKDHIVPVSRGGSDDITNIQPLCIACNKSKFTRDRDYRTRGKVALPELNAVGKLLFDGGVREEEVASLKKHKVASRFTGVYFQPKAKSTAKPWRAIITVDKKRVDLGRHATAEEAAVAYNEAARRFRGEHFSANEA